MPTRSPWPTTPRRCCCGRSPTGPRGWPTSGPGHPTARLASWRKTLLGLGAPLEAPAADRRPAEPAAHRPPAPRRPTADRWTTSDGGADGRHHRRRHRSPPAHINVPEPWPQPPHHRVHHDRHLPARGRGLRRRQPAVVRSRLWRHDTVGRPDRPSPAGGRRHPGRRSTRSPRSPPTTKALTQGDPLRGVHTFYSSSAREWWAPMAPGMSITRRNALVGVLDKPSEFAERAVHEWSAQVFRAADGPAPVGAVPAT